jgi:radical SAM superfamily enzyme
LTSIASQFWKSLKQKVALQTLQEQFNNSMKMMKMYHKIKWLLRWQVVTTLYDSLENVITYYQDAPIEKDDGFAP